MPEKNRRNRIIVRVKSLSWLVVFVLVLYGGGQAAAAAELELAGLDGKEYRLSDYRGQWVVVNYWATWCPPCVAEMPELVFFHDNHKDKNALVLGVNYERADVETIKAFVEEHMVSYPILLASPDEESPLGRIRGLPTTFLISPEGKRVHSHLGPIDVEYLEQFIANYKPGQGK